MHQFPFVRFTAAAMAIAILAPSASAHGQNLVLNGSFETPINPLPPGNVNGPDVAEYCAAHVVSYCLGNTFGGWTVYLGTAETVRDRPGFWTSAEGDQSVDLNGISRGGIFQDIATTPGSTYALSFAMSGNFYSLPANASHHMSVYWGGGLIGQFTFNRPGNWDGDNMGWVYHGVTNLQTLTSTTRLAFESDDSYGCNCAGPALDDVSVLMTSTSTPEPATFALMATGLCAIVGVGRRRRAGSSA